MINVNVLPTAPSPMKMSEMVKRTAYEYGKDSLPEYTSATRLNPVVLIDKTLTLTDEDTLSNILQTMLSIYTAHYLQAVALSTPVEGVDTIKLLDKFSTNRDLSAGRFIGSAANFVGSLVSVESSCLVPYDESVVSNEAKEDSDLQSNVNLAIGRLVHVKVGAGDKTVTMPVSIVLNPRVISSDVLPNVLAMTVSDDSFSGRWHKWRSGEIESFVDYALALDLIERDKKALLNDDSGLYIEARRNKTKGFFATLLTGDVSLNSASAMAVITKRTAEELELAIKGKLVRAGDRDAYFKATNSMMLVVVDTMAERLSIYQRGISEYGMYTFTDIKDHSKKSGAVDIGSILKAYKLGEAPSL